MKKILLTAVVLLLIAGESQAQRIVVRGRGNNVAIGTGGGAASAARGGGFNMGAASAAASAGFGGAAASAGRGSVAAASVGGYGGVGFNRGFYGNGFRFNRGYGYSNAFSGGYSNTFFGGIGYMPSYSYGLNLPLALPTYLGYSACPAAVGYSSYGSGYSDCNQAMSYVREPQTVLIEETTTVRKYTYQRP